MEPTVSFTPFTSSRLLMQGAEVCALEKGVIYELESEREGETKDRVDSK